MKHEHKETIIAWLNGIECEYYCERMRLWCEIDELSDFDSYAKVRIKPEPQYQEPQFFHVYRHIDSSKIKMCNTLMRDTSDWDYLGKVRIEQ